MDNLNLKEIIPEGFEQWKGMAYNENDFLLLTQHRIGIWNSHVLKCSYFLLLSYTK